MGRLIPDSDDVIPGQGPQPLKFPLLIINDDTICPLLDMLQQ